MKTVSALALFLSIVSTQMGELSADGQDTKHLRRLTDTHYSEDSYESSGSSKGSKMMGKVRIIHLIRWGQLVFQCCVTLLSVFVRLAFKLSGI